MSHRLFSEARRSGRDFERHPWRHVPIPQFDPDSELRQTLAALMVQAENETEVLLVEMTEDLPEGGQLPGQAALTAGEGRRSLAPIGPRPPRPACRQRQSGVLLAAHKLGQPPLTPDMARL